MNASSCIPSKDVLRWLIDSAPLGIALFDADKRYQLVNTRLAALNELPVSDHLGRRPREILPFGSLIEEILDEVLGNATHVDGQKLEDSTVDAAGRLRCYSASYWPLLGEDGVVLGVGTVVTDVTDQAQTAMRLLDSEAKYRTVIEAANDAFFLGDINTGILLDINQQAADLVGRRRSEIIGRHQSELHPSGEGERYRDIFTDHSTRVGAISDELEVQHAAGHRIPVEISARRTEIDGQPVLVGIFRDISERRRQLEALERINSELRQLDDLKNNLLANVSHELRSPLVGIRGYVELLISRRPDAPKGMRWLGNILKNCQRLESIIDRLLQVSALHAGLLPIVHRPVPVDRLVDNALSSVLPSALEKGIHLTSAVPADLPAVGVDEMQITSVLVNLLDNAIKFSSPDTEVNVTAWQKEPAALAFRVTDHGIGIAPEHQDRVFDRFFQVDSSSTRPYGGFGLGLAIVREVISSHRGTIRLESELGHGTSVEFSVPRFCDPDPRDSDPDMATSSTSTDAPSDG